MNSKFSLPEVIRERETAINWANLKVLPDKDLAWSLPKTFSSSDVSPKEYAYDICIRDNSSKF